MVVYICQFQSLNSSYRPHPLLYPHIRSLHLHPYSCLANRFICVIFLDSTHMHSYKRTAGFCWGSRKLMSVGPENHRGEGERITRNTCMCAGICVSPFSALLLVMGSWETCFISQSWFVHLWNRTNDGIVLEGLTWGLDEVMHAKGLANSL